MTSNGDLVGANRRGVKRCESIKRWDQTPDARDIAMTCNDDCPASFQPRVSLDRPLGSAPSQPSGLQAKLSQRPCTSAPRVITKDPSPAIPGF